uniref:somatostatin receptor type 2-like n=1 Tax=Ciona intestinalis TaxID=7719 RepID=UPI000521B2E7|nr:somatostatin receptor type 2-like [Ciona intestinalis]|eukprot:XP_002120222.3 somatostatin receptor type 2-like [Ciona intestinalis]
MAADLNNLPNYDWVYGGEAGTDTYIPGKENGQLPIYPGDYPDFPDNGSLLSPGIGRMNCSGRESFYPDVMESYPSSQIVVPIVYCIMCLIGLIGNGLVMFVIFGSKEMTKTVANIYVWNLTVADTLLLVSLPFNSTQRLLLNWPFGSGMCKIVETVKYLNYFASVFFLTAMSIDRYIAVAYVVTSGRWRTSRNTFFVCAAIWMVSLVIVIPLLIHTKIHGGMCALVFNIQENNDSWDMLPDEEVVYDYGDYYDCNLVTAEDLAMIENLKRRISEEESSGENDNTTMLMQQIEDKEKKLADDEKLNCKHPDSKTFHAVIIFTFVIGFVIPFIIISACYIMIIVKLQQPSGAKTRSRQAERTRRKITRMVVALVIAFFICRLPFYVWHLVLIPGVDVSPGVCHDVRDFTFCLGFINSCLNPILYTFLGHNFQERLRKSISISLHSFSFTNFTKFTTNTVSRAETAAQSKKMDTSHIEVEPIVKTTQPLYHPVREEDLILAGEKPATNGANATLLEEREK